MVESVENQMYEKVYLNAAYFISQLKYKKVLWPHSHTVLYSLVSWLTTTQSYFIKFSVGVHNTGCFYVLTAYWYNSSHVIYCLKIPVPDGPWARKSLSLLQFKQIECKFPNVYVLRFIYSTVLY